jgi:toluene monooxygenase system ferredoxin subunit
VSYRKVADPADLWPGEMRVVVVDGVQVLIANLDGEVVAYEDRCAHQGVPLSRGRLDRPSCALTCSAHGWQYDLRTGAGINPKGVALRRLPVKIDAGGIWVETNVDKGRRPR